MYLEFTKDHQEIISILNRMEIIPDVKSVMLMIADDNHPSKEFLDPILNRFGKPIIGGVFPEVIVAGQRKSSGCMILGLRYKLKTLLLEDNDDYLNLLQNEYSGDLNKEGSLLMFVDALCLGKSNLLDNIYNTFGTNMSYLGAGCGSLSLTSFPCIIHNSGMHSNVGVVGLTKSKAKVGVAHGWQPVSKSLKVTEAEGNTIKTLDWMPAFKVYKKEVFLHSGEEIDQDNFFDIAKSLPFGMVRMDDDMIMRDILKTNGSDLFLLDAIEEGEYVRLMMADVDSLLEGAKKSRILAEANNSTDENLFCIDCITRALFMGEHFEKELNIIQDQGHLNGVLGMGEIANIGESYLNIYNKTSVVVKW